MPETVSVTQLCLIGFPSSKISFIFFQSHTFSLWIIFILDNNINLTICTSANAIIVLNAKSVFNYVS